MLVERSFFIGGAICVVVGALLLADLALQGALSIDPLLAVPAVLFLVFGGIFLATARSARRHREGLLREGETGLPGAPPAR
jgi:hypothetical protein